MREEANLRPRMMRRLVALTVGVALLTTALGAGAAAANGAGDDHGAATFTKWVTDWPNMAGVVGGSVGRRRLLGQGAGLQPGPDHHHRRDLPLRWVAT